MSTPEALTLPFGKHKGVPLTEIPSGYLRWALAEGVLRSALLTQAVETVLAGRNGAAKAPANTSTSTPKPGGRRRPVLQGITPQPSPPADVADTPALS